MAQRLDNQEMCLLAIGAAMEKKAFRPVLLDLRPQGAFTEFFAIVSAANGRQVVAVAEAVKTFFKTNFGLSPVAVDGLETQTWVLMDYAGFFVHVFQDPTRELYQLERLWSKGRLVPFAEETVHALYNKTISPTASQPQA